jgi:antitoxin component of RelBE/YafQ-DinJ toxin-antitoxin module
VARRPLIYLRTDTEVYRRARLISERTGQTLVAVIEELLARALGIDTTAPPPAVTLDQALAEVSRDDAAA